jgi:hypothetical protein
MSGVDDRFRRQRQDFPDGGIKAVDIAGKTVADRSIEQGVSGEQDCSV